MGGSFMESPTYEHKTVTKHISVDCIGEMRFNFNTEAVNPAAYISSVGLIHKMRTLYYCPQGSG